jgi:hypothetical protein
VIGRVSTDPASADERMVRRGCIELFPTKRFVAPRSETGSLSLRVRALPQANACARKGVCRRFPTKRFVAPRSETGSLSLRERVGVRALPHTDDLPPVSRRIASIALANGEATN